MAQYRWVADQVSLQEPRLDPLTCLVQWANETNWGGVWAGEPYNLANIRDTPATIARYASFNEFENAYVWTMRNSRPVPFLPVGPTNNYYWAVLAAGNTVDQLRALVASPWSSGHYGGSLDGFLAQLEAYEMTPEMDQIIRAMANQVQYGLARAGDPTTESYSMTTLKPLLDDIKAAVAGLVSGGGSDTSDDTVVLNTIDGKLDRILAELHTP